MRSIVGSPPRGEDFLPRPEVIKKIYRKLETSHIYLSAPRRVGKTAVMRHLEDNPKENYEFKYIITQACESPIEFYKLLIESVLSFRSLSAVTVGALKSFLNKIASVDILGNGIKLKEQEINYQKECKSIFSNLETNGKKVVIMIDEFTQTVDNIWKTQSHSSATSFLFANREIQAATSENIKFIYTGSLGLQSLCTRMGALDALNHLNVVDLGPLSKEEATELASKVLQNAGVKYDQDIIDEIIIGLAYLIPFHIQLVIQELIDNWDEHSTVINKADVLKALITVTDRRANHYFEHYHNHIKKAYDKDASYDFILHFLTELSQVDFLDHNQVSKMAEQFGVQKQLNNIISFLEYDGYIYADRHNNLIIYRFTAPILKLWWGRNMT